MATEVKVPTLGESVTEATVGQWLKKPGEAVALDEPIVSLETDKVAVDVPSPVAGTLGDIMNVRVNNICCVKVYSKEIIRAFDGILILSCKLWKA